MPSKASRLHICDNNVCIFYRLNVTMKTCTALSRIYFQIHVYKGPLHYRIHSFASSDPDDEISYRTLSTHHYLYMMNLAIHRYCSADFAVPCVTLPTNTIRRRDHEQFSSKSPSGMSNAQRHCVRHFKSIHEIYPLISPRSPAGIQARVMYLLPQSVPRHSLLRPHHV